MSGVEEGDDDAGCERDRLAVGGDAAKTVAGVERVERPVERRAVSGIGARALRRVRRRASSSCRWAASSMTSRASSRVAPVAMISPRKPRLWSSGIRPQWSRWAWVSSSTSIDAASKPNGAAFSSSSSRLPWKKPQSMRMRLPAASTRWHEPVTSRSAPWKEIFMSRLALCQRRPPSSSICTSRVGGSS